MRTTVNARVLDRNAASTSEMGRIETEWLASEGYFAWQDLLTYNCYLK